MLTIIMELPLVFLVASSRLDVRQRALHCLQLFRKRCPAWCWMADCRRGTQNLQIPGSSICIHLSVIDIVQGTALNYYLEHSRKDVEFSAPCWHDLQFDLPHTLRFPSLRSINHLSIARQMKAFKAMIPTFKVKIVFLI